MGRKITDWTNPMDDGHRLETALRRLWGAYDGIWKDKDVETHEKAMKYLPHIVTLTRLKIDIAKTVCNYDKVLKVAKEIEKSNVIRELPQQISQ